jgi:ABC-type antimicrobial peptide transport system permease subunit
MFRSYLKIAWRSIQKNTVFSVTNLLGLSIGMTCTVLILLWVQDEVGWDRFHPNYKNIYQVMVNRNFNGEISTDNASPFPMSTALKQTFPEVKNAYVDNYGGEQVLRYNETLLKRRGYTVSTDYFKTLHWTFIKGSAATAFSSPQNIVLTESMAKALFADAEPLGKVIKVDNADLKTVSAVVQDPPSNSTFNFSFLYPFNPASDFVRNSENDWVNSFTQTFVEVKEGTDITALSRKITAFVNAKNNGTAKMDYFLHPMEKWRLYSDFRNGVNTGGTISYVRLFSVVAVIILLIACVNFMNLSTAKSEKRAKEVGIRKTLGSERKQLILQFYSESFLFSVLSLLIAVLAVYTLLPLFNSLVNKTLQLNLLDAKFLELAVVLVFLTTAIAGSYPALYLSSFNPVKVLKGSFLPGPSASLPRKVLVVLQFGISVLLISSTVLVYQQIQHVKNRDLGYNANNLLSVPASGDVNRNAEVMKNELLQTSLIASVTRTSAPITDIWNFTPAPDWKGKPADANMIMSAMGADANIVKTIGARLIEGRDFTNAPADSSAMILNKAALEVMQLKNAVGTEMRYGNRNYTVVGVTENLVMASPYAPVMPMMILPARNRTAFFLLRLKDGVKPQEALAKIESIFKRHNPEAPFEFNFIDEEFNRKFLAEDLLAKLSRIFAGLAIFICCLGLSGLASFTIERRFKEIGIRKVLGASVQQLLVLISKEFVLLVSIAALISLPLTWWLLNNWLQNYQYRTGISVWLLAGSCFGVLLLTLVVVWLNAIRAALANPAKSLRAE